MDQVTFTQWKGKRVWLRVSAATIVRQFGEVIDVLEGTHPGGAAQLVIRLEDGTNMIVTAVDKGKLWDLTA